MSWYAGRQLSKLTLSLSEGNAGQWSDDFKDPFLRIYGTTNDVLPEAIHDLSSVFPGSFFT